MNDKPRFPVPPLARTELWKDFDRVLGVLGDTAERTQQRLVASGMPATAAAAWAIAFDIHLADQILKRNGDLRAAVKPLLEQLAACSDWAWAELEAKGGGIH